MKTKFCLQCGQPLKGRIDKKFCDDHCRSAHNNRTYREMNFKLGHVNRVLKRNRHILEQLHETLSGQNAAISREKVQELGFVFNFHTHTETLDGGNTLYCCYDYGYIPVDERVLKLVRRN